MDTNSTPKTKFKSDLPPNIPTKRILAFLIILSIISISINQNSSHYTHFKSIHRKLASETDLSPHQQFCGQNNSLSHNQTFHSETSSRVADRDKNFCGTAPHAVPDCKTEKDRPMSFDSTADSGSSPAVSRYEDEDIFWMAYIKS